MKTTYTHSAILTLPEESDQLILRRLKEKKLTMRESSAQADALIRAVFAQKQAV